MENENTNTATSEQPEERKRITAMQDVIEGGADDWGKRVISGVQQYIDVIQQALNPMRSEDVPFITAALKIYRDGIKEDLDPAGQRLDKTIREIVNKNGTECKRTNHTVEIHTDEDGADELLRLLKRGLMPDALAKELAEAGYEKRGDAWVKRANDDGSEETEEVD